MPDSYDIISPDEIREKLHNSQEKEDYAVKSVLKSLLNKNLKTGDIESNLSRSTKYRSFKNLEKADILEKGSSTSKKWVISDEFLKSLGYCLFIEKQSGWYTGFDILARRLQQETEITRKRIKHSLEHNSIVREIIREKIEEEA